MQMGSPRGEPEGRGQGRRGFQLVSAGEMLLQVRSGQKHNEMEGVVKTERTRSGHAGDGS